MNGAACVMMALMVMMQLLLADTAVIPNPTDYDLSTVPPTDTSLLKDEAKRRELQGLDAFKAVVQDVLTKKAKKRRTPKHSAKKIKSAEKKQLQTTLSSLLLQQAAVSQNVIDTVQKQLQAPELQEKIVSLKLKAMPVKEALALLAKSTGVQLVVDGDVTGNIQELRLDNVPLSAALHSILGSNEPRLALLKDFGVWRVMKLQTAKDLFASMAAREREKDFASAVITIKYAKWNDQLKTRIEKLWQGIVQASIDKQNMYMVLDDVNHKIFCKAHKEQIEDFKHYMQEMDINIPQIKIDARVIIANKDFEEAIGFNWSGVYNRRQSIKHVDFAGLGPYSKTTGNPSDQTMSPFGDIAGWALNLVPSLASSTALTQSLFKIPFVFGNKDMNTKRLNIELNAAEYRNEVKTIMKPSMLICNEETAEIISGETFPNEVRLNESVDQKVTNVTTVSYKDIGMKIRVKPIVSADHNAIMLDIFVENSVLASPTFDLKKTDGNLVTSFNYTIRTSRSLSHVLLRSGQTTMISGLITSSKTTVKTGLPFLQDIPVLGYLFQGNRKEMTDMQLLIFITPTLVEI